MTGSKKILKILFTVVLTICVIFTATAGFFVVANFTEVSKMMQVGLIIKTQYLKDVSVQQMLRGAIGGMVESLGDPYSVYMDAKQFKDLEEHIQGSLGGIGIYVGQKDNKLVVVSPIEGTPAAKAGIQRGDFIVKINDAFTSDLNIDQAVANMRGEPGTKVNISVMRAGVSKLLELTLTRENINVPTVESDVLKEHPEIGYLRLTMFASNTDEAVDEQLQKLTQKNIKALVLDLRDNAGGGSEGRCKCSSTFCTQGPNRLYSG